MIWNVIWTPEATETFNSNLDYLEKEWDLRVSDQFTERVYNVILKISQNPKLYACIEYENESLPFSCHKTNFFVLPIATESNLFDKFLE